MRLLVYVNLRNTRALHRGVSLPGGVCNTFDSFQCEKEKTTKCKCFYGTLNFVIDQFICHQGKFSTRLFMCDLPAKSFKSQKITRVYNTTIEQNICLLMVERSEYHF